MPPTLKFIFSKLCLARRSLIESLSQEVRFLAVARGGKESRV